MAFRARKSPLCRQVTDNKQSVHCNFKNTAIAFGNLATLIGATDSGQAGSINAVCTNGTPTPGFKYASARTTGTDFRMQGAGSTANDFITYTLYQHADGATAQVTGGTAIAHPDFTATGATQTLVLSAKILATDKQLKLVQSYTDTITVTTVFGI